MALRHLMWILGMEPGSSWKSRTQPQPLIYLYISQVLHLKGTSQNLCVHHQDIKDADRVFYCGFLYTECFSVPTLEETCPRVGDCYSPQYSGTDELKSSSWDTNS